MAKPIVESLHEIFSYLRQRDVDEWTAFKTIYKDAFEFVVDEMRVENVSIRFLDNGAHIEIYGYSFFMGTGDFIDMYLMIVDCGKTTLESISELAKQKSYNRP